MISVLAHRGLWQRTSAPANSLIALTEALHAGIGIESDVRDRCGRLVISHDVAGSDAPDLDELVEVFGESSLPFAVNVKADGLAELLAPVMNDHPNWFAFDMSVPEMVRYSDAGIPFFTRHSDVEPAPVMYRTAEGVWLDGFREDWYTHKDVEAHLNRGKKVAIVSPELHGRDPRAMIGEVGHIARDNPSSVYICTDCPDVWQEEMS